MKIACIILASGSSERFGKSKSKLFHKLHGTPIIEFTLKNILNHFNRNSIYITIPKKITKNEKKIVLKFTKNELIFGGKTRFESLTKALQSIDIKKYESVMIHDAARPITPNALINDVIRCMSSKKYDCVAPASIVEDTIRKNNKTLDRTNYMTYQTPQIFKLKKLVKNVKNLKFIPTDDLGILEDDKQANIKIIEASKENIKITTKKDIIFLKKFLNYNLKYGSGFDIHRLIEGKYLSLAGLKIKCNYQSIGHSDGDVIIHSIIDAILGATSKGDIGKFFPPLEKYKNISSITLLNNLQKIINYDSMIIKNLDCTIICQKVRLEKYKTKIRKKIAGLLQCNIGVISVKAKTADNVGTIGKSKAIACWTTVKILKI